MGHNNRDQLPAKSCVSWQVQTDKCGVRFAYVCQERKHANYLKGVVY